MRAIRGRMVTVLVAAVCGLVLLAIFVVSPDLASIRSDHERMQGSWRIVTAADSGESAPTDERITRATVTFDETTMTLTLDGKAFETLPYQIDEKHTPGRFDLGDFPGIYELSGNTLRICVNEASDERSNAFESKKGSPNDLYMVLKRR